MSSSNTTTALSVPVLERDALVEVEELVRKLYFTIYRSSPAKHVYMQFDAGVLQIVWERIGHGGFAVFQDFLRAAAIELTDLQCHWDATCVFSSMAFYMVVDCCAISRTAHLAARECAFDALSKRQTCAAVLALLLNRDAPHSVRHLLHSVPVLPTETGELLIKVTEELDGFVDHYDRVTGSIVRPGFLRYVLEAAALADEAGDKLYGTHRILYEGFTPEQLDSPVFANFKPVAPSLCRPHPGGIITSPRIVPWHRDIMARLWGIPADARESFTLSENSGMIALKGVRLARNLEAAAERVQVLLDAVPNPSNPDFRFHFQGIVGGEERIQWVLFHVENVWSSPEEPLRMTYCLLSRAIGQNRVPYVLDSLHYSHPVCPSQFQMVTWLLENRPGYFTVG